MKDLIIVIASDSNVCELIADCCKQEGLKPLIIERQRVIPEQQLVIDDSSVRFCQVDLLQRALGAVILDSGYMWPQPGLAPGTDEQHVIREGLDVHYRNQRESASFWYSFLEILNDRLPLCVNPQSAFTSEAFKPWTLDFLRAQGVSTAPFVAGNDGQRLDAFVEAHPGPLLWLPIVGTEKPRWDPHLRRARERNPVFLQALSCREETRIIAVNGQAIHVDPDGAAWKEAAGQIPRIQAALKMPLAELVFRRTDRLVLSDFKAAPDLAALGESTRTAVLSAVCELIAGAGS